MKPSSPIFCDIGITEQCIFRCKMCKSWQSKNNYNELSMQEWKNFIVSLEEFGSNDIRVHFSGGEPLLKNDILDLAYFAHKEGHTTVMVTNGFLIDYSMSFRIADSGLDVISISLDSLDAQTHDFLRGQKGAYRRVLRAIDNLRKAKVKSVSILSIIMAPNINNIIQLADWVNNNDYISSIYFQAISPRTVKKDEKLREHDEFGYLWPKDINHLDSVIDRLIDYKNKGYKISNSLRQLETFKFYFRHPNGLHEGLVCNQGDYVVNVRPDGDVFLCGAMSPLGNIRKNKIKEIWNSEEAFLRRQQMRNCRSSCLNIINCFEDKSLP